MFAISGEAPLIAKGNGRHIAIKLHQSTRVLLVGCSEDKQKPRRAGGASARQQKATADYCLQGVPSFAVVAVPGRRAHAIEDQRVFLLGMLFRREGVVGRVQLHVTGTTAVKFGEERLEPVGLLVIDRNG